MDSETTANELEQAALLARHFGAIDAHPLWRQAKKIFIPENNLGLEASHMDTLVRQFHNVFTFVEKDRAGIHVGKGTKRDYQMFMVHSLYNHTLYHERDGFTTNRDKSAATIWGMARAQIERFHWEVKASHNETFADPRVGITGKTSAQDENGQDDLAIAMFMAPFWGQKHKTELERLGKASGGSAHTRVSTETTQTAREPPTKKQKTKK